MRAWKVIFTCVALGASSLTALAQNEKPKEPPPARPRDTQPGDRPQRPGGMRETLAPEKAKAAQELQATGVAKRLSLKDDQVKAVVKAYTDARESYSKANEKLIQELRDKQGDRQQMMQERMKAMEDLTKSEREKFEKALGSTLTTDQTSKVMASLGAFVIAPQWDRMTDTIAGFKLDAAKQQTAQNAIEDFVVAQAKIRPPGRDASDADREAAQKARQEARDTLDGALKKVLSDDQVKKFEETLPRGGRGGPGGGPGRRGGGGGG